MVGSVQMARGVSGTISVWPAVKSTTTASVALRASRTLARHEQRRGTFIFKHSLISIAYVLDAGPYHGVLAC